MIKFNDLGAQWGIIRDKVLSKIDNLGYRGSYINGPSVKEFEDKFASHYNTKHATGVSNGTDGLKISLQVLNPTDKDAVIIPTNTFIADYLSIKNLPIDAKPTTVLIDHNDSYTISVEDLEAFLKENHTKFEKIIVIAVHLYGHACDMDRISYLKSKYNFYLIEDCSQSHGTKYKNQYLGNFGEMAVYSLYPGKNLGAMGDAGIITTNNKEYDSRLKTLRNYGSKVKYYYDEIGHNHRLDSIQAIILNEKLNYIDKWTHKKIEICSNYLDNIFNSNIKLPKISPDCTQHSFHIFCIEVENRKHFIDYVGERFPLIIHYPIPIYKTNIFDPTDVVYSSSLTNKTCEKIVSIPIHPFLEHNQVDTIIKILNEYSAI